MYRTCASIVNGNGERGGRQSYIAWVAAFFGFDSILARAFQGRRLACFFASSKSWDNVWKAVDEAFHFICALRDGASGLL
jgi:hypothetical protein